MCTCMFLVVHVQGSFCLLFSVNLLVSSLHEGLLSHTTPVLDLISRQLSAARNLRLSHFPPAAWFILFDTHNNSTIYIGYEIYVHVHNYVAGCLFSEGGHSRASGMWNMLEYSDVLNRPVHFSIELGAKLLEKCTGVHWCCVFMELQEIEYIINKDISVCCVHNI